MNWRHVWALALGDAPGVEYVSPLLASLLLYSIAFIICYSLYAISRQILPKWLNLYLLDFFKTLVICTYPYGHSLVRTAGGHVAFCVVVVPLVMFTLHAFNEGSPSPLDLFTDFIHGKISLVKTLVRIVVQTAAGFASFRLVQFIWSLEFHKEHVEYLHAVDCSTDLKVPLFVGFLIESCAVMYDTWLSNQRLFRIQIFDDAVKILNGCLLVCVGLNLTGMYMHPAMASGLTFGCKGTTAAEHIFVYWIGSFLGCYGAIVLSRYVRVDLVSSSKKPYANGHGATMKNGVGKKALKKQVEKKGMKRGEKKNQ